MANLTPWTKAILMATCTKFFSFCICFCFCFCFFFHLSLRVWIKKTKHKCFSSSWIISCFTGDHCRMMTSWSFCQYYSFRVVTMENLWELFVNWLGFFVLLKCGQILCDFAFFDLSLGAWALIAISGGPTASGQALPQAPLPSDVPLATLTCLTYIALHHVLVQFFFFFFVGPCFIWWGLANKILRGACQQLLTLLTLKSATALVRSNRGV